MNAEPTINRCPKCQAPLPANAPQGLCPKCLLAAVSTPTEAGQPADKHPPPPIPVVAAAFPQLEILELIGRGGMGAVYKARQPKLDRLVALKLLPQSLAADAMFAERFNREARVLARLNHPNIVTVHDFGQSEGFFYLLMEFVDGVNLRQAMQAGRFTPQQAMMLVPKICDALQFAHDEGVLHRDIKPENILLDTRGRVKIADFGLAKLVGEAREKLTLTASGAAVGTPHYMAPEQLEHPQDVDQRADLYSLGVVFYEMLTGELPIGRFAPPSEKSEVDARVDDVVLRALEKEREKRFRTATEVKTSVEAITSNPAQPPPPRPSAGVPIPERRIPCYISTPEHLRTFIGRIVYIYTGQGELRLDAESLTFVSNLQFTVIPLGDIRELGIGHYSRLAKPVRLDYLAVTFEQTGERRTLLFTPCVRGGISLPMEVNPRVSEWLQAVREAITTRTGKPPEGSSSPSLTPGYKIDLLRLLAVRQAGKPPDRRSSPSLAPGYKIDLLSQAINFGLFMALVCTVVAFAKILVRSRGLQGAGAAMSGWTVFLFACVVLAYLIVQVVRAARAYRLARGSNTGEPLSALPGGPGLPGAMPLPANPVAVPGNPSAGASTPAASEGRATCYFNTPRRMRDCFPNAAACIFTCKGELQLGAENLTFTSTWRTAITIPLKDIEDLSVGQFQMWTTPWVMKYARLNFLSVSYRRQGESRTVLLTPVEPEGANASQINDGVGRWFERVCQGVKRATGVLPHRTDPASLAISAEPAWNWKGLPLLFGFLLTWLPAWLLQGKVAMPIWVSALVLNVFLLIAMLWFAVGFLRANSALWRGDLDAVTSDDPPAAEPAGAGGAGFNSGSRPHSRRLNMSYVGILAAGLLPPLVLLLWGLGTWLFPSAGKRAVGSSFAPQSEDQFVIYTIPTTERPSFGARSATNQLSWTFKCLVPAEHLARVLFVRWSNGVPVIETTGSAYCKVGKTSMAQDLYVNCVPFPDGMFPDLTNTIRWAALLFGNVTAAVDLPRGPTYRQLKTPARLNVRSGHQGILRLVDYVTPEGQRGIGHFGVELRIFLEPLKSRPIRTDPFEVEGTDYVAGRGLGWTMDQALEAIKEWPVDQ